MAVFINTVNEVVRIFNFFHPRIQCTIEIGRDKLNFLDLTIIKNNNALEFDWFHIFREIFELHVTAYHPHSQKTDIVMGMVDRVFLLSESKFHEKNVTFIINTLLNNDYPLNFIFNTINNRLKSFIKKNK